MDGQHSPFLGLKIVTLRYAGRKCGIINAFGQLSYCHQAIHVAVSQRFSHAGMKSRGQGAQLKHISQYGNLILPGKTVQHLNGGPHGLRVGIVTVVQDGDILSPEQDIHPHFGGRKLPHALSNLLGSHTEILPHCGSHQRGIDHVLSQGRYIHPARASRRGHSAGNLTAPIAFHLFHPVVQPLFLSTKHRFPRRFPPQCQQKRIIPVEDGQCSGFGVIEYLSFSRQGVFPASESLDMRIPDIGDTHHIGLSNGREVIHLPGMVNTKLNHSDLVMPLQPQQGHGQPNVVVLIPLGFQYIKAFAEYGSDHIFGRGLPHTACHGHNRHMKPSAVPYRQIPKGPPGRVHFDVKLSG